MFKKLESKIEYSNFSKLIKLSDSIKSSPTHFAPIMLQSKVKIRQFTSAYNQYKTLNINHLIQTQIITFHHV